MKKIKMFAAAAMLCAAAFAGYTAYEQATMTNEEKLFYANLEALTDDLEGNPANYGDCLSNGGNWDMASICVEAGFESASCTISGEISVFGITIKGSYEKGRSYSIPWAQYQCQSSSGNCCIKQGLFSGEEKLA